MAPALTRVFTLITQPRLVRGFRFSASRRYTPSGNSFRPAVVACRGSGLVMRFPACEVKGPGQPPKDGTKHLVTCYSACEPGCFGFFQIGGCTRVESQLSVCCPVGYLFAYTPAVLVNFSFGGILGK
jgi:hypothetical protein